MMARILIEAIQKGEETRAREIIRQGSYGGIDSQTSSRDGTALFMCCSRGCMELATLLIERGANANAVDKNQATPLHAAADNGHIDVVKLLLRNGANLDAQTFRGDTPLHMAAFRGYSDICELMVEKGSDPCLLNTAGFSPEDEANSQGHLDLGIYLRAMQTVSQPEEPEPPALDMMIPIDPPSGKWMYDERSGQEQSKRHNEKLAQMRQPDRYVHPEWEGIQRRVPVCTGDVLFRPSISEINDLSFMPIDPPSDFLFASDNAGQRSHRVIGQRHSTSAMPAAELPPLKSSPSRSTPHLALNLPPSHCQSVCYPPSTTAAVAPATTRTGGRIPANLSGLASLNVPPQISPPPLQSPPYMPSLRMPPGGCVPPSCTSTSLSPLLLSPSSCVRDSANARRPSTASTNSCFSDTSLGAGSDVGSTGSDASSCHGEFRRDDLELLLRNCQSSSREDKKLCSRTLSLGVRNPPDHKQITRPSSSLMSLDSSDLSDIFDSSHYSLGSLVSGPPSSSASMDTSSSGEYRGRISYTIPEDARASDNNDKGDGDFKKRPSFNKSISADGKPALHTTRLKLADDDDGLISSHSRDVTSSNNLSSPPSSLLPSPMSNRSRPNSSMTCVNIPLH